MGTSPCRARSSSSSPHLPSPVSLPRSTPKASWPTLCTRPAACCCTSSDRTGSRTSPRCLPPLARHDCEHLWRVANLQSTQDAMRPRPHRPFPRRAPFADTFVRDLHDQAPVPLDIPRGSLRLLLFSGG